MPTNNQLYRFRAELYKLFPTRRNTITELIDAISSYGHCCKSIVELCDAPCFTRDGRIVYNSEYKDKKSEISIANIDGSNIVHLTNNDANEWHPEVSSDGKQIAFMSDLDGKYEIYTMNIDGANLKRLTHNTVEDWYPSWSPDGSKLIFGHHGDGKRDIYMMNKDGSSKKKIIEHGTQPAWLKIAN